MSAGGKKSSKINGVGAAGSEKNQNADDEVVVDD